MVTSVPVEELGEEVIEPGCMTGSMSPLGPPSFELHRAQEYIISFERNDLIIYDYIARGSRRDKTIP
jgi:hypothetical protein